jgi:hypothetical protein
MFHRLFKRKQEPAPQQNDWEAQLVWLSVGHTANPFAQEVLDCRSVALSFQSTTSSESVAESFARLRASDGREARGRLPEHAIVAECDLYLPQERPPSEGAICVARAMEDKWDFYIYDSRLYVRRSWTGQLTHVAEFEYDIDTIVIRRIHCDPKLVHGDADFGVTQLVFLITTHLGRGLMPFPIPPGLPRSAAKQIALTGFTAYGRHAQFASYASRRDKARSS